MDKELASHQHSQCSKWLSKVVESPLISFLRQFPNPPSLVCSPCRDGISGGFNPSSNQITLCEQVIKTKQQVEDILAHEHVHAYDNETVALDWQNQKHQACTEIRAINLSGECKFTREIVRGNLGIGGQLATCVRRRAILGLVANGISEVDARKRVEECWKCFEDLAPFDEIY